MPWKVPVYLSKEICIYKKPRNLRGFLMNSLLPVLSRGYVEKAFGLMQFFFGFFQLLFPSLFGGFVLFFSHSGQ